MVLDSGYTSASIQEKLIKILNAEKSTSLDGEDLNHQLNFIAGVSVRTNPSMYTITIEVQSKESKNIIVRLLNSEGKIERMFSWYIIKGANITTLTETTQLPVGLYRLDIIDHEGILIYNTQLQKSS